MQRLFYSLVLAFLGVLAVLPGCGSSPDSIERSASASAVASPGGGSRHWLGPGYWGNRLQDWRFEDGRIRCVTPQGWLPMRTVHDLTRQVEDSATTFRTSVMVTLPAAEGGKAYPDDAGAGLLIGVGNGEMDYRAAAIVHHWQGMGAGLFAGVDGLGQAFIVDNELPWTIGGKFDASQALSRKDWTVSADSAEAGSPASRAIDGKPDTLWHTEFKANKPEHPHELIIDLGEIQRFAAIAILPRQDNDSGRVGEFEVYATNAKGEWGEPIKTGTLPNSDELQIIELPETSAHYVRLVAKSAQRPQPVTSIAEVFLLRKFVRPGDRPEGVLPTRVQLTVNGEPLDETTYALTLEVRNPADGSLISSAVRIVEPMRVLGNVALVSHPGTKKGDLVPALFGFEQWTTTGKAVKEHPDQQIGPIVGTMYTLSKKTLKMTAQLMPLADNDPRTAELQVDRNGRWRKAAEAPIVTPGYTATFRIDDWDDTQDTRYRVVYRLPDGGRSIDYTWSGTVRRDPVEKDKIVVAALSCNEMNDGSIGRPWSGDRTDETGNWVAGMFFPHADLTAQLAKQDPDLYFFAGDQIYEGRPTFPDRQNIELDYLYKWNMFVISYRDLMKDTPTITIPDDHDVYQGNVWGEGGRKTPGADNTGGYVHPATFVQMVHRTQTSHLPDPADPSPIEQGISYYSCDLHWGRVGFAIFADRMFKSGCADHGLPPSGTGRPDHYNNENFDTAGLDLPGLKLLGDRQLNFLDRWAGDWSGVDMKLALSQTVFANMATHHGQGLMPLIADLDSNGWPQAGRNKALAQIRKAFAMHVGGDQHLASLVHMGIDDFGDAPWSFCVPSTANLYPRAWAPAIKGKYEFPKPEQFLGNRLDGFKNKVTVYAAANPGNDMGHLPRVLHNGMPGYGIIVIDKPSRTYTAHCWPRFADPADPTQQYPGWPRTINQLDNFAKAKTGFLPEVRVKGVDSFVIKLTSQKTGELVYALRVNGTSFRPFVFEPGQYALTVTTPDRPGDNNTWTFTNIVPGEYDQPILIETD